MPPGWVFGAAWTTLYTLMGISLALVIAAPDSAWRRRGIIIFLVQLALNYLWSPVFFAMAAIDWGFIIVIAMAVALCLTIPLFWRVNRVAALLLLPYLVWLCLATALNFEIGRLNPGADRAPLGITSVR
jgi:tryptophan-rich sensory protein